MLWQTCRSAAITLSAALAQSFRRLEARKQRPLPADVDAEIQASFNKDLLAVTLAKKPAVQKPENKIEAAS
jgi:HSP20 family molecular chaperone IbpA